jgi:hypothetical protein
MQLLKAALTIFTIALMLLLTGHVPPMPPALHIMTQNVDICFLQQIKWGFAKYSNLRYGLLYFRSLAGNFELPSIQR